MTMNMKNEGSKAVVAFNALADAYLQELNESFKSDWDQAELAVHYEALAKIKAQQARVAATPTMTVARFAIRALTAIMVEFSGSMHLVGLDGNS